MNATVPMATGEIVLISDANSMYAADSLRKIARNFADPAVGCVTGEERRVATADGAGLGESLYCRFDNWIKRLEGQVGSMVMVNGGFVAIRRELYPALDPRLNFDLVWAPLLQLRGYRTVYEPEAVSVETYPLDAAGDFRRRVRTVMQAFYSYLAVPQALNPLRTGWYAVRLFSHRFARWFVLPALAVALLANLALAANVALAGSAPLYLGLLIAQLVCYAAALAGWLLDRAGRRFLPFYIPYYFVYVHAAAFTGVVRALTGRRGAGRRVASWKPTERLVTLRARAGRSTGKQAPGRWSGYDARHFGGPTGQRVLDRDLATLDLLLGAQDSVVLDIPCGTGILAQQLSSDRRQVVACDASPTMLEMVAQRAPQVRREQCDIRSLPFPDSSFDATITMRLFQHLPFDDVVSALRELQRVIKPGGRVIFDTFGWSPRNLPVLRKILKGEMITWSWSQIEDALSQAELSLVRRRSCYLFSPIAYRKLPLWFARSLDLVERAVPQRFLLRTFWSCTKSQ